MFKIPKKADDTKYGEELKEISLDEVKKWITDQDPKAFAEKRNLQQKAQR
jgi:DNA topoisomerase-1